MTTRITLSILLTTWVILFIGETAAFLTAGQTLLRLLDDTILTRAANLDPPYTGQTVNLPHGDQYQVTLGKDPLSSNEARATRAKVTRMFATRDDGHWARTITLNTVLRVQGQYYPATITYSRPAEQFQWLLKQLAVVLLMISLACGLTTAWLALKLSRAALRPLHETANVIAEIDEKKLGRRIDANAMPIELVPMTGRLNEMLERLENVFQQRKQFLADAAHELRTPTASLLTTLEVALRRPRDQAALTEAMQTVLADARRLRKLVEQLMEHARSEHVRGPEAMQMADVSAVLRECVEIVTPLAREKDVTINGEFPGELPFVTQHDRLRSIVLNLLSNAVEYNRSGGQVSLRCVRENGELQLTVKDTGRGISSEQLPHVFEPFYRGGQERGDDPSHLGLGLFLVRSHVDALGGQCTIDSHVGDGTTLNIRLPQKSNDLPKPAPAATAVSA